MYHIAMGVSPDDPQLEEKIETIATLPAAEASVRVTLLHIPETDVDVADVPVVARALGRFDDLGVAAEAVAIDGNPPSEALIDVVEELDPHLVIVGGRRRSPAGKLQLKAGAQQVILRADRPVLVAGAVDETDYRT